MRKKINKVMKAKKMETVPNISDPSIKETSFFTIFFVFMIDLN